MQENRRLFDACTEIGGNWYPVDSVPMDRRDWQRRYGVLWAPVIAAQKYFDPDGILAPGQGLTQ